MGTYPYIDNKICEIVGNTELPGDIAKLLGVLRSNICYYNSALEKKLSCEILEDALLQIYHLINPINEDRFTNYSNAQIALRNYELKLEKKIWVIMLKNKYLTIIRKGKVIFQRGLQ